MPSNRCGSELPAHRGIQERTPQGVWVWLDPTEMTEMAATSAALPGHPSGPCSPRLRTSPIAPAGDTAHRSWRQTLGTGIAFLSSGLTHQGLDLACNSLGSSLSFPISTMGPHHRTVQRAAERLAGPCMRPLAGGHCSTSSYFQPHKDLRSQRMSTQTATGSAT